MDQLASVLLSFPPTGADLKDNDEYNAAAKAHVKRMNQAKKDDGALLANHAVQLLQHVDPAFNSISYAYLLHTIYSSDKYSELPEDLAECTVKFLMNFDARQIRYAGAPFSSLLDVLKSGESFPPSVAVELLASALLRLDPTGSILTSHHLPLVKLAYQTENTHPVLQLISKSIVFYPGMRGQAEPRPLCDTRLPSSAYVSIESGLTGRVTSSEVMEYDLVCGLIHLSQRDWSSASAAFERVCAFPTRDLGCSTLMAQAYNKWLLVGLLLEGRLRPVSALGGPVSAAVQRSFAAVGKPVVALAKAFEKGASDGGAAQLKAEAEAAAAAGLWADERNDGLVREVLAHYQRHHILRLREVYSKIGLDDVRELTHSAETGRPLDTAADVEALVRAMIASGLLAGTVVKPAAGAEEGDGTGHLVFLPEGEELSEPAFAAEIERSAQRIRDLAPVIRATNERLGASRDYVRHLVKAKRDKVDAPWKEKYSMPDAMSFDSLIDEDLMTGVLSAGL